MTTRTVVLLAALCGLCPGAAPAQDAPTGRAVLERMRAAYAGRWYDSLAFVQRTVFVRDSGPTDTMTWFESLKGPDLLRIDFGSPPGARYNVFTAESSMVFRDGRLVRADGRGNIFLPLMMGAYLQPVEATERGLRHHGFDLGRTYRRPWEGADVIVVGASSWSDSTSAQFWVEAERLVVVRVLAPSAPGGPPLDVRISGYVPVDGGWLGTRVSIAIGGVLRQTEEYTEWSTRVPVPDELFVRQPPAGLAHWAASPRADSLWTRGAGRAPVR